MHIIKAESRHSEKGGTERFTGDVWLDEIAAPVMPSRLQVYRVTFAPGAHTAWHSHPQGQVLHVLSGVGCVQTEGGPLRTIRPGDTVIAAPGERHWHGATSDHLFVHLAMQELAADGSGTEWSDHVSDTEYQAPNAE
jgi:quercetin dioxygenase-like cupin family protein